MSNVHFYNYIFYIFTKFWNFFFNLKSLKLRYLFKNNNSPNILPLTDFLHYLFLATLLIQVSQSSFEVLTVYAKHSFTTMHLEDDLPFFTWMGLSRKCIIELGVFSFWKCKIKIDKDILIGRRIKGTVKENWIYNFLETCTSNRSLICIIQRLRFSGFILYPL